MQSAPFEELNSSVPVDPKIYLQIGDMSEQLSNISSTPKHKIVLMLANYYLQPDTISLQSVAIMLGITRTRVSYLYERAKIKILNPKSGIGKARLYRFEGKPDENF